MKNTNTTTKLSSKEACTLAHQIRRETGCSLADAFKAAYNRNTTPAAPKTSWTMDEITQLFSDKVAELLRKGYVLDPVHMNGHQGEISKVLFTKNGDYFQLIMDEHSDFGKWYGTVISIRFGKYTEEVRPARSLTDWSDTLWTNKFDTSWEMEVAKIADNYYVTLELAEQYNNKRHERFLSVSGTRPSSVELSERSYKAALACVRKQKGFKGTKLSDIVKVTRKYNYNINDELTGWHYDVELNKPNKYGKNTVVDIRF